MPEINRPKEPPKDPTTEKIAGHIEQIEKNTGAMADALQKGAKILEEVKDTVVEAVREVKDATVEWIHSQTPKPPEQLPPPKP